MKSPFFSCLLGACLALGTPQAAAEPQYHDAAGRFLDVWQRHQDSMPFERMLAMRDDLLLPFGDYYGERVAQMTNPGRTLRLTLESFAERQAAFELAYRQLKGTLPLAISEFANAFADFQPCIPVWLVHSLTGANGQVLLLGGEPSLVLGVDMVAESHDWLDQRPFLHHELVHLYRLQQGLALPLAESPTPLLTALWEEGLATYVAQRLNPGASLASLMLEQPLGLSRKAELQLAQLAANLYAYLGSDQSADYERYFLLDQGDLPRAGYYLGYRVVSHLGKAFSLDELMAMKPEQYRPLVEQSLFALAKQARWLVVSR
ncbi:DUF2268 domain-containing putative Zn-dependent protease [Gallaecimonas sp. GXIMD4217]|uniref:DUF2268 domain-containing putative Zn-dependent protease n=1 Tax=Gallaecimonas sp. GXIMD4217 TaxID=3131927 RepID=UPI00311B1D33